MMDFYSKVAELKNQGKDLVIVTNVENNKFYKKLQKTTSFENDNRVKFVGTVYDRELLLKIRENAFAYIHGHEVGGTNPSLLEALGSTKLNLALSVDFNKEVCGKGAFYWDKELGDLSALIQKVESLDDLTIRRYDYESKQIIKNSFSWSFIVDQYESLFNNLNFKWK